MFHWSFTWGLFLTFNALLTGAMAERLDNDLVGVVVAAVVIGVLVIVIIAFMAYCCFRQVEYERNSVTDHRKDSGSVSGSMAPGWAQLAVPSTGPLYSLSPTPVLYAVNPANYYLGNYSPRFLDAERLQFTQSYGDHVRLDTEVKEGEPTCYSREHQDEKYIFKENQQNPIVTQVEPPAQPNGHVVQELASPGSNYKVIRKNNKQGRMPDWLRKKYSENEMSMDVKEDASQAASLRSRDQLSDVHAVRAHVSPKNSRVMPQDVLHVSRDFTIIDYVDPEKRLWQANNLGAADDYDYRLVTTSQSAQHQQRILDASPISSSYKAAIWFSSASLGDEDNEEHERMRKAGEGSVTDLPSDTDSTFDQ